MTMSNAAACALDALHQLAASASEVHAASQTRIKPPTAKLRVELKSEEDRIRKRQLRLLKNRQSAALSRQRKKEYINDLEKKAGHLNTDNSDLEYKVTKLTSMTIEYKLQVDRLEKQLQEVSAENAELRGKLSSYDPQLRQQMQEQQALRERERERDRDNRNALSSSSSSVSTPTLTSSCSLQLPSLPSLSLSDSASIPPSSSASPTLPPLYPPHNE